jgi:hypothetical protein
MEDKNFVFVKLRHANNNFHKKSRKKSGGFFAKKYKKLNIQEMIIKKKGTNQFEYSQNSNGTRDNINR